MKKIAGFIVGKRKLVFLFIVIAFIFSLFSQNWVEVESVLEAYLPPDSETRMGLDLMEREFVTFGTAEIMVENVTYEEAKELEEKVSGINDVYSVAFDDTSDHYHNASALFSVTFSAEADDPDALLALEETKRILEPYDIYVSTTMGNQEKEIIEQEVSVIILLVAVIVGIVLVLTSQTYAEVLVLALTFVTAMVLNRGTDFFLGKISFVSNSVTSILQLALSLDYAVILCNRFKEEHRTLPIEEAAIIALSKAIPEIGASCLTTIGGLIAMLFMKFRIGVDMGICLIKSIFFALFSVFLFMPGLLVLFGDWIDRTAHKSFLPKVSFLGKLGFRTRHVVPIVFLAVGAVGFLFSRKCPYAYGYGSIVTPKTNIQQESERKIAENFTSSQLVAVVLPDVDHEKEKSFLRELETYPEVHHTQGLANTEAMDGYMLTDRITPRQFAELMDIDYELSRLVFGLYTAEEAENGNLSASYMIGGIPLMDLIEFLSDLADTGVVELEEDLLETLRDAAEGIRNGRKQLEGENCSRVLVYLNLKSGYDSTYEFLDTIREIGGKYYDKEEIYRVGNLTTEYDFKKSFAVDNITVSVISIMTVLLVLLFTFKSVGMPILLISIIQGSIWINFAVPFLTDTPIFFMCYLIVSAIQMGANIDYAIVIASRFQETRQEMPIREALIDTVNFAFPTVITSGTILALSGYFIGSMTSEATIAGIGQCIFRGTLISILLVLLVLPAILAVSSDLIDRSSFDMKKLKLSAALLFFLGLLAVAPVSVKMCYAEETAVEAVPEAEVFPERTIHVGTVEDLLAFSRNASLDSFTEGLTVSLDTDLSLEEVSFSGIPSFGGTFLGNGHRITGFTVEDDASGQGFFGILREGGEVRDLTVEGSLALSGKAKNTGGITGVNCGTISGCSFLGSVSGHENTGGIVGRNEETGIVAGCRADGSVSGLLRTGGICGQNSGLITDCTNLVYVNIEKTDPALKLADLSVNTIEDLLSLSSFDTVNVARDTGGICGYSDGSILSSMNTATVGYQHIGYNTGGICGRNRGFITGCQNSGSVYGRKDIGGIVGQAEPDISELENSDLTEKPKEEYQKLEADVYGLYDEIDAISGNLNSLLSKMNAQLSESERLLRELEDTTLEGVSGKIGEANEISDDVEYLTHRLNEAQRDLESLSRNLNSCVSCWKKGAEALKMTELRPVSDYESFSREVTEALSQLKLAAEELENGLTFLESAFLDLEQLIGDVSEMSEYMDRKGTVHFADDSPEAAAKSEELSASLKNILSLSEDLNRELHASEAAVTGSARRITEQSEKVADSLNESAEEAIARTERPLFEDTSESWSEETEKGTIRGCINDGPVSGDLNIGGITGLMDLESELDPEADYGFSAEDLRIRYQMKVVISGSKNYGAVTGKKDCIASVCGRQNMGLITDSLALGSAESTDGSYVGGIAGLCFGTVRKSDARCRLDGNRYVGGIIGSGKSEEEASSGSTVEFCRSLVEIGEGSSYRGAVSGTEDGIFTGNIFVSDILSGLGRISLSGKAEPVSYGELLGSENLPGEFRTFFLRFYADGKLLREREFAFGQSFGEEVRPAIPPKEGMNGSWDRTDLCNLQFDTDVHAVYETYTQTIGSEARRNDGRRVLYAEGSFTGSEALFAEATMVTEEEELWNVTVPHDGSSEHYLRYLPASGEDVCTLYLVADGTEKELTPERMGSYLRFAVEGDEAVLRVRSHQKERERVLSITALLITGALLFLVLVFFVVRSVRKKKKGSAAKEKKAGKKKKIFMVFHWVFLVGLAAAGVLFAFLYAFHRPVLRAGVDVLSVIMEYERNEAFDTDIRASVSVGEEKYSFDLHATELRTEGKDVYCITLKGITFYVSEGILYLPGGNGFRAWNLDESGWGIIEQIREIYRTGEISAETNDGYTVYSIETNRQSMLADMILSELLGIPSDTKELSIRLSVSGKKLVNVGISCRGEEAETGTPVIAEVDADVREAVKEKVILLGAVSEALRTGEWKEMEISSEDALHLVRAMVKLLHAESLCTDVNLSAACGPLSLSRNEKVVLCGEEADEKKSGSLATLSEDILIRVYEICQDGRMRKTEDGKYEITLTGEQMQELMKTVLPKASGMEMQMEEGRIILKITEERIEEIEITESGIVRIVQGSAPASLNLRLSVFAYPAAVAYR